MVKKNVLLVTLLFVSVNVSAQITGYTAEKLINTGKLAKADVKINAVLAKSPDDCNANFAASRLVSTKGYSLYDPEKAYQYLEKSQNSFNNTDPKHSIKLQKQGYGEIGFGSEFERISQIGLNVADSIHTLVAYNHFLSFYLQSSDRQKASAVSSRNQLAFEIALNENTVESYTYFLDTYHGAEQTDEALSRRNSLAFGRAASIGTVKAFEDFIRTYPDADEVSSAWQNIYKLEYENALKSNSETVLRSYAVKYPNSPYAAAAIDRANLLQFANEVTAGDWQSYRRYINNHRSNKAIVTLAQKEIFNIASRSYDIAALDYLADNCNGYMRDSALIMLHDIYANTSIRSSITDFYSKYDVSDCKPLADIKEREIRAVDDLWYNNEEFIRAFAPNFLAVKRLSYIILDDIKAKRWNKAFEIVSAYKDYFGNDYKYLNLYNTLKEPFDKSVKINNMGSMINSNPGSQYSVVISADSKTLLFCGRSRKDSKGGEDIFISTKKNGVWTKSKLFPDINTSFGNEGPEALSVDGTQLLLFKNGNLCVSHKNRNGWSYPELMPDNINICTWQADAMMSSDGKAILFAAAKETPHELQEGFSVYDHSNIYVSLLGDDGEWGEPIDLGHVINTPFCDRAPFLHPDMKTLYFSSEGHGSFGSMDIFMSTRLNDDSWTEWSEPINLGKEINTVESDCWYKISTDGKTAFFSKADDQREQIFWLNLPEKLRPNAVATISGQLRDTKGNPVATAIRWEDLEENVTVGQSQTDPADGSFFIVLPMGKNYGYYINSDDYFPISNNLDLRKKNENIILENNIEVASIKQMMEDSIPMPLNNIFFAVGDSALMPSSVAELIRVAALINRIGMKVEISGHTDNTGDFDKNQLLSQARANSVYNFLIAQGCNSEMLTTKGYGQTRPVATNKTVEGRQKNRRVEIRFLKDK